MFYHLFLSFTLYRARCRVGRGNLGNLVSRHSISIKTLPFPTFRGILEALRIKRQNSMPQFNNFIIYYIWGQSWRRGTRCDCKIDWLRVRSPFDEMNYIFTFIFSFLRSGVETKSGVVFRHSTRQCLQNLAQSGELSVITLGCLCLPCCVRDTAWRWFNLIYLISQMPFNSKLISSTI